MDNNINHNLSKNQVYEDTAQNEKLPELINNSHQPLKKNNVIFSIFMKIFDSKILNWMADEVEIEIDRQKFIEKDHETTAFDEFLDSSSEKLNQAIIPKVQQLKQIMAPQVQKIKQASPYVTGKAANVFGKILGFILPNLLLPGYDLPPQEGDHNYLSIAGHVNSYTEKGIFGHTKAVLFSGGNEIHKGFRYTVQKVGSVLPEFSGTGFHLAKVSGYVPLFGIPAIIQGCTAIPLPYLVSVVRAGTDLLPSWFSKSVWFFNAVNFTYIKNEKGDVSGSISGSIANMRQNIKGAHGEELLFLVDHLVKFISEQLQEGIKSQVGECKEIDYDKRNSYGGIISRELSNGFITQTSQSILSIGTSAITLSLYAFINQFFVAGQKEAQTHQENYRRFKEMVSTFSEKVAYGQNQEEKVKFESELFDHFVKFEESGNKDYLLQIQRKYHLLVEEYVRTHGGWENEHVEDAIFQPYFDKSNTQHIKSILGKESGVTFSEEENLYDACLTIKDREEQQKQLKDCFLQMSDKFLQNSTIIPQYEQAFIQILVKLGHIVEQLNDYEQEHLLKTGSSVQSLQMEAPKQKYQKEIYNIVKKTQRELLPVKCPDWIVQALHLFGGFGFDFLFGQIKFDEKAWKEKKKSFDSFWEFRAFDGLVEVNNILEEWKVKDSCHAVVNKTVTELVKAVCANTSLIDLVDLVLPLAENFIGTILPQSIKERAETPPFTISFSIEKLKNFKNLEDLSDLKENSKAEQITNVQKLNLALGEFTDFFTFECKGKMYKAWLKNEDLKDLKYENVELSVIEIKPYKLGTTAEAFKKILKGEVTTEHEKQIKDVLIKMLTNCLLGHVGNDFKALQKDGEKLDISPKEVLKAVAPFLGGWGNLIDEGKNVHSLLEAKAGGKSLNNKIKGVFDTLVKHGKDVFNEEIEEYIDQGLDYLKGDKDVKKDKEVGELIEDGNKKVLIGKVIDKTVGTVTGIVDHTVGFLTNRLLEIAPQLGSKLTIKGQERMGDPKFLKKASAEVMKEINQVLDLHAKNPNSEALKPLSQKKFIEQAIEALLRPLYPNGVIDMPYPPEFEGMEEKIKEFQLKAWDHLVRTAEVQVNDLIIQSKGPLKLNRYEFIQKEHLEKVFRDKCKSVTGDNHLTIAQNLKKTIYTTLSDKWENSVSDKWENSVFDRGVQKVASVWNKIQNKKDMIFDWKGGRLFNLFLDKVFGFIFFTLPKYTVVLGTKTFWGISIDHFAENIDSAVTSGLPEKVLQVAVLSTLRQLSSVENKEYRFKDISAAEADTMYKTERRKLESNVINTVLKGTPLNLVVKVVVRIVDIVASVLIAAAFFIVTSSFLRSRIINLASYLKPGEIAFNSIEDENKYNEEQKECKTLKEEKEKLQNKKNSLSKDKITNMIALEEVEKQLKENAKKLVQYVAYDSETPFYVRWIKWLSGEEIVAPQRKHVAIKVAETFFTVEGDTPVEYALDLITRAIPVGADEYKKIQYADKKKKLEVEKK